MNRKKLLYKNFIYWVPTGVTLLVLFLLNIFYQTHWLDSDMAAEMMFSKLLSEEGHLISTQDWFYSSEFRILYTQLVMTPLFHILNNWHIIRLITNLVFYVLMIGSYCFCMKPLGLSQKWIALSSALLLTPISETMMLHMQMGNTYMSHVILIFLILGLFLRLAFQENRKSKKIIYWVTFTILTIICGASGVRYILSIYCPLLGGTFCMLLFSAEYRTLRMEFTRDSFGGILKCRQMKIWLIGIAGMCLGIVGYGINLFYISKTYSFQTYESTNFIPIYQGILGDRIQDTFGSLIMLLGYIPDKGFLSLRGLISLCAFGLLLSLVWLVSRVRKLLNRDHSSIHFFVYILFLCSFILNSFVFIFTTSTIVPRYYITVLILLLPLLAIYLSGEKVVFDRRVFLIIVGILVCITSLKTVFSFISADKNADKAGAIAYLVENDYSIGYATYWNGNIVTELSNGQLEVANLDNPDNLEYFLWSSPKKYYENDYATGKVFLLLSSEEQKEYLVQHSENEDNLVYEDADYVIYGFGSKEELLHAK